MVSPDVEKYGLDPWLLKYFPIPFMIVAVIAVTLRVWIRSCISRCFGWDDTLLMASLGVFLVMCASLIASGQTQLERGVVEPADLLKVINFVGVAAYIIGQVAFKSSMAAFFLRILIEPWQRRLIVVSVSIFAVYSLGMLLLTVFQCGDPTASSDHCLPWTSVMGPVYYAGATLNAVLDWCFALVPIIVIRKLHMERRDKFSTICIIILAVSGSIISVIRIPYINGLNMTTDYYSSDANRIAYTSVAEFSIQLVVASMATYRPLLRAFRANLRRTFRHDTRLNGEASEQDSDARLHGPVDQRSNRGSVVDLELNAILRMKTNDETPTNSAISEIGPCQEVKTTASSHMEPL